MSEQLLVEIIFELLDLGIRLSTNRHGDQEKYVELRKKLRKELVAKANEGPTTAQGDGWLAETSASEIEFESDNENASTTATDQFPA